jgi:RNA-binding protein YlmH
MQDNDRELQKRFGELAYRAFSQQRYTYSEFLTPAEQGALLRTSFDRNSASIALWGGYDDAERKMAQFGSEEQCGYVEDPPIHCISIKPLSQKFADMLTHRDFLGALMALGVRRSVLGDIILYENCGYLFCLDSISGFITGEFTQVKHTSVKCELITSLPEIAIKKPDISSVNVASERLDAVIAAVYKLSRGESQALFAQNKVFVNSYLTEDTSHILNTNSIISVRGFGRFIYEGIVKETKKGRLFVNVRIF